MAKLLRHYHIRKDQEEEIIKRSQKGPSKAQVVRNALDYYFKNKKQ